MAFWFFGRKKDGKVEKLKSNLNNSFSNIKKDMNLIDKVLNQFKDKHEKHDQRLDKIEQTLMEMKEILEKNVDEEPTGEERSIVHERSIAFKRSNQSFMNVQKLKNVLTPAQKRVIQLLMIAETPLEYGDIAKELKLSIITVRRHVNDVKKMGFNISERVDTEARRKVFYLDKMVKRMVRSKK
ncbi:MAG: HTH domain-containing protein [Nanoarchaeota archaeon]